MRREPHDSIPIPLGPVNLRGDLAVPEGAPGLVLFSHGSDRLLGVTRWARRHLLLRGQVARISFPG